MNLIELEHALRQLRLGGIAAVLETRLRQAQAEAMAPIDLISCLVTDELTRRSERLLDRRRKQAAFRDVHKTLDNFDFTFNPKMNRSLIFDLATCGFIAKRHDALFLGPGGTGKSHLAQAIDSGQRLPLERLISPERQAIIEAALAAEAAGLQGHFWEMHDLLYKNQAAWSKASDVRTFFTAYARSLSLDVERFAKDSNSDEVKARIFWEEQLGVSRGVKTTPTLFINDRELRPPFTTEHLRAEIDAALGGSKSF